jgi:hypothetical protein
MTIRIYGYRIVVFLAINGKLFSVNVADDNGFHLSVVAGIAAGQGHLSFPLFAVFRPDGRNLRNHSARVNRKLEKIPDFVENPLNRRVFGCGVGNVGQLGF